jgi:membrane protein implicated in regulation of membrane protease activity
MSQEIEFRPAFKKQLMTKIKKFAGEVTRSWLYASALAMAIYPFYPDVQVCLSFGYFVLYLLLLIIPVWRRVFSRNRSKRLQFPGLLPATASFFLARILLQ